MCRNRKLCLNLHAAFTPPSYLHWFSFAWCLYLSLSLFLLIPYPEIFRVALVCAYVDTCVSFVWLWEDLFELHVLFIRCYKWFTYYTILYWYTIGFLFANILLVLTVITVISNLYSYRYIQIYSYRYIQIYIHFKFTI